MPKFPDQGSYSSHRQCWTLNLWSTRELPWTALWWPSPGSPQLDTTFRMCEDAHGSICLGCERDDTSAWQWQSQSGGPVCKNQQWQCWYNFCSYGHGAKENLYKILLGRSFFLQPGGPWGSGLGGRVSLASGHLKALFKTLVPGNFLQLNRIAHHWRMDCSLSQGRLLGLKGWPWIWLDGVGLESKLTTPLPCGGHRSCVLGPGNLVSHFLSSWTHLPTGAVSIISAIIGKIQVPRPRVSTALHTRKDLWVGRSVL